MADNDQRTGRHDEPKNRLTGTFGPTGAGGDGDAAPSPFPIERRDFVKALSAGAVGLGLASTPAGASSHGGPPDPENWQIRYEDDFDSGSLDTANWGVGWGWGTETTQGSMYTDERAISFGDSTLELRILDDRRSDGRYPVGAVHTKGKLEFGPGTYLEARTRAANLPGVTSNFWSKISRNPPEWPPEIDIKEVPIYDEGDENRSIHHVHWTTDGQPGGPHSDLNMGSHGGYDHSAQWTVYGLRWLEDSITYYINGQEHARTDRSDVMASLNNGTPFYVMLDIMNWPGPERHPADFSGYKTTHEIDWIRVWEPGSGGGTSDGSGSTDDGDSSGEDTDSSDDGSSGEDPDSTDDDSSGDDSTDGDTSGDDSSDGSDSTDGDSTDGSSGEETDSTDGDTSGDDSTDGDTSGDDSTDGDSSGDDSTDGSDSTDGDSSGGDSTDGDSSDGSETDGSGTDEPSDSDDSSGDSSSDDSRPWWRRDDEDRHPGRRDRDGSDRRSSWRDRLESLLRHLDEDGVEARSRRRRSRRRWRRRARRNRR